MMRKLWFFLLGALAVGCAAGSSTEPPARSMDPEMIMNKTWQWEATVTPVETITAAAPERYTLFLGDDGRAQVGFDCNRGGGEFTISPGRLSFGPMMSTHMACPEDSQDARFAADLQRAALFFVEDGFLYLDLVYHSGTMRFSRRKQ